ncbi:hypothetical protein FB451DRAFT_1519743 [Mycena latifolia]|nr:hypothetical protein FB451DRAFT_1519743 [Mycena latifolia]
MISSVYRPACISFPAATVTSAQLIRSASFSSVPAMATFTFTSAALPAPTLAASLGACVPRAAWFAAIAESTDALRQASCASRASRPSRSFYRRAPACVCARCSSPRACAICAASIRLPPGSCTPRSDASNSDCDLDCQSDSDRSTTSSSSAFSSASAESLTSAANSAPAPPPTAACIALPAPALPTTKSRGTKMTSPRTKPALAPMNLAKMALAAYLYQGGVTRVMSDDVMLGARPDPVVKFKRS